MLSGVVVYLLHIVQMELRSSLKHGADDITVNLQTVTNLNYKLKVKETDKIKKLKTRLYETSDIKCKMKLVLRKETLDDEKRLQNYDIQDGSVIQILFISSEILELYIHVFKKGILKLEVSDCDTVCDLRQRLSDSKHSLGSAPQVYDMFYNSDKLEEDVPLHFYEIPNRGRLDLKTLDASFKISIEASFAFKVVAFLEVKGTDHVGEVKRKVMKIIADEEEEDIKMNNVVIFHNPKNCRQTYNELDCDRYTLNRYGLEPHDYLVYIIYRKGSQCADMDDSRRMYHIHWVSPMESVQSFRLKVQDQLGIPFAKQRLTFPGLENPGYGDRIAHFEDIKIHVSEKHVNMSPANARKKNFKCKSQDLLGME